MRNDVIEKAMYGILVLVFLSVAAIFYVLIGLDHDQQQQIQKLNRLTMQQQQTITQVKQGVADLENSNNQQTAYIKCIAEFFAQPNRATVSITNLAGCQLGQAGGSAASVPVPPSIGSSPKPIIPAPASPAQNPSTSTPPASARQQTGIQKALHSIFTLGGLL